MNSFYFKKWYFDLITDDAEKTLYAYFIVSKIFGLNLAHIAINLHIGNSEHIKSSKNYFNKPIYSSNRVNIGFNSLTQEKNQSTLKFYLPEISLDLTYYSLEPQWCPSGESKIIKLRNKTLSWIIAQPKASVKGKLKYQNKEVTLNGTGYQDIIEMTIPFWSLPIDVLFWGRAHCGEYTIVFNQLFLKQKKSKQYLYAIKDKNIVYSGEVFSINYDDSKKITEIKNDKLTLYLNHKLVIEENSVITSERIKGTLINKFLSNVSGNPFEKKIVSDAILVIESKLINGFSIHEKVTWQGNELST